MDPIREIHYKNDYYVALTRMNDEGCYLKIPENLLQDKEQAIFSYLINNNSIRVTNELQDKTVTEEHDKTLLQAMILCDILVKLIDYNVDWTLLICFDEDKNLMKLDGSGVAQTIRVKVEDKKRQEDLFKLVNSIWFHKNSEKTAEKLNLKEEYVFLTNFIESGGFQI